MSNNSLTPEQIERMKKIEEAMKKQKSTSVQMEITFLKNDQLSLTDYWDGSIDFYGAKTKYEDIHKKSMELFEQDPIQLTNLVSELNISFAEICINELRSDVAEKILGETKMLIENSLNNYGGNYDANYAGLKKSFGKLFACKYMLAEAESNYAEAASRFKVLCKDDPHFAAEYAYCNIELAEIYIVQNQKEKAVVCLNNARPYCFDLIDEKKFICVPYLKRIESNLSDIYLSENDYISAEKHLLEEISLIQEIIRFTQADINDPASDIHSCLTETLNKIAEVYIKLNKPHDALQYLKEAFSMQEKLFALNDDKNVVTLAFIHHNSALAYEMIGDSNAAQKEFLKVLPLLEVGKDKYQLSDLKYNFRECFYLNLSKNN